MIAILSRESAAKRTRRCDPRSDSVVTRKSVPITTVAFQSAPVAPSYGSHGSQLGVILEAALATRRRRNALRRPTRDADLNLGVLIRGKQPTARYNIAFVVVLRSESDTK